MVLEQVEKISELEKQKKVRMKQRETEERMRHRDSVKRSDILLIVISEREKRKNGVEAPSGDH